MKSFIKGVFKGCNVLLMTYFVIVGIITTLSTVIRLALTGRLTMNAFIKEFRRRVLPMPY